MVWVLSRLGVQSRDFIEMLALPLNWISHLCPVLNATIPIPVMMKKIPIMCCVDTCSLRIKMPINVVPIINAPDATGNATDKGYTRKIASQIPAPNT